jgi:hypothetical protein
MTFPMSKMKASIGMQRQVEFGLAEGARGFP